MTESFGEKIKLLMGDINDNIDKTYQRLDGIEEKIKVNDELTRQYFFLPLSSFSRVFDMENEMISPEKE